MPHTSSKLEFEDTETPVVVIGLADAVCARGELNLEPCAAQRDGPKKIKLRWDT